MVSYVIALKNIASGLRQLQWVMQINLRYVKALQGGLVEREAIFWHKGQAIGLIPHRSCQSALEKDLYLLSQPGKEHQLNDTTVFLYR